MNIAKFVIEGIIGVAILWQLAFAGGKKYVEVRWIDTAMPVIELMEDNVPRVSLPVTLKKDSDKHFPNYRVPDNQDYLGDWAEFYDYVNPERRASQTPMPADELKSQRAPFIALGDFNHDMVQDVAVLLVKKHRINIWKLVIFHGGKSGYHPSVIVSSPARRKHDPRKGYDYGPVYQYGIRTVVQCSDGRECLHLGVSEAAGFEYLWKDGHYIERNTHD